MKILNKEFLLRPIVNTLGAPTYQLSKHLAGTLSSLVGCSKHHIEHLTVFFFFFQPWTSYESDCRI